MLSICRSELNREGIRAGGNSVDMKIEIISSNQKTTATFLPEWGGTVSSLMMPNMDDISQERLYRHDFFNQPPWAHFPGGAPFCFPICGRLERGGKTGTYYYDGKTYQMNIHGFAWQLPWKVKKQESDSVTLVLESSDETLKQYPFHFRVELKYQVKDGEFICFQTYENTGEIPMPYAAGFHPYFLTPPANAGKEKVTLHYQPTRRFVYNEKLTDLIGETALFSLPTSIANTEINEQLTMLGENKNVELHFPSGEILSIEAQGREDPNLFSYLQLYTIPDRSFICVEPWMSFPNALNTVQGMRWLQPGKSEHGNFICKCMR